MRVSAVFFLIVFTTYNRTLYFVVYLEVIFLSSNNPTYLFRALISTICRSCAEIFSCSPMFINGVLYFFFKELEHEKEKEDIRKKKAAAKRRDKRKRKKAAKDSETLCGVQVGEDLPLENRPQEMVDDFDHDQEDNVGDVVDTTREPCSEELLTENNHQEMKTDEKEYLLAQDALKNRQIADDDRNKLKICPSNKRSTLDSGHAKPKRPLSSTGDVSTPQNSLCPHQKGRARSQSAGKETELKNNTLPDKNSRKKSDEPAKITKKKIIPSNSDKADSVKTQKIELKTKTTSEVTQSVTVNCVKPDVKQQIKAEKPSSKKESSEKANSSASSPKKNSYSSKQQNVGNTSSVGDKSSSSKDSSVSGAATTKKSSDATQPFVRRGKDTTNAVDNNTPTTSTVTDSRTSTKGTLAAGHSLSGSNKTTPSEGEREHKPGESLQLRSVLVFLLLPRVKFPTLGRQSAGHDEKNCPRVGRVRGTNYDTTRLKKIEASQDFCL